MGKPASSPLGVQKAEAPSPAPAAARPSFFPSLAAQKDGAPVGPVSPARDTGSLLSRREEPADTAPSLSAPHVIGSGVAAMPEVKLTSSGPVVIAAMPMPSAAVQTRVTEPDKKPAADEQASVPLPPRQIDITTTPPLSGHAPAVAATSPELVQSEADTSVAAATALGALVAGFAVASAQADAAPAVTVATASSPVSRSKTPAAPSAPAVVSTTVAPPVAAAQPPAATPVVAAEPAVRTLEDAVAEMLRPMLQQWLTDHMPRIIERALRVETAKTVKDVTK